MKTLIFGLLVWVVVSSFLGFILQKNKEKKVVRFLTVIALLLLVTSPVTIMATLVSFTTVKHQEIVDFFTPTSITEEIVKASVYQLPTYQKYFRGEKLFILCKLGGEIIPVDIDGKKLFSDMKKGDKIFLIRRSLGKTILPYSIYEK